MLSHTACHDSDGPTTVYSSSDRRDFIPGSEVLYCDRTRCRAAECRFKADHRIESYVLAESSTPLRREQRMANPVNERLTRFQIHNQVYCRLTDRDILDMDVSLSDQAHMRLHGFK
eukprot:456322-Hanusia_phi.AAC.1